MDYLTEAQKKAYILADNRFALDVGWDEEMLRVEMEALQGMDFDVSLTGFDEAEIADLLSLDDGDAQEDDFDMDAELAKPCVARSGDVWHLCITFNKDKSISKASARHIRSREEFEQLLAYLPQLIRTTAEEILRGNIQVAPYRFRDRNACTFCSYRSICSFDPELGQGDRYREIADNAQTAMEEIAQMVCGEVKSDG